MAKSNGRRCGQIKTRTHTIHVRIKKMKVEIEILSNDSNAGDPRLTAKEANKLKNIIADIAKTLNQEENK